MISFQASFEKIDNYKYFQELTQFLNKKFTIKIIKNKFYKGHLFKKEDHFFMIGKKK